MGSEEKPEKVAPFAPRPKDLKYPWAVRVDHKKPYCSHPTSYIDRNARVLSCQTCEAVLDPIEQIASWAQLHANAVYRDRQHEECQIAVCGLLDLGARISITPSGARITLGKDTVSSQSGPALERLHHAARAMSDRLRERERARKAALKPSLAYSAEIPE
jgi:hypothetical protein